DGIRYRNVTGVQTCALPIFLVGYLMEVYRDPGKAEHNFCDFALFSSFFPAILSGPIARSTPLLPQLKSHREPGRQPTGADLKTQIGRATCRARGEMSRDLQG